MTTLAATRMRPIMTVTAAATDRTMTSRILLVVAVLGRTGQRSHRGYRPASHMASCNHSDRHFGASPAGRKQRIRRGSPPLPLTWHFSLMSGTHSSRLLSLAIRYVHDQSGGQSTAVPGPAPAG